MKYVRDQEVNGIWCERDGKKRKEKTEHPLMNISDLVRYGNSWCTVYRNRWGMHLIFAGAIWREVHEMEQVNLLVTPTRTS